MQYLQNPREKPKYLKWSIEYGGRSLSQNVLYEEVF